MKPSSLFLALAVGLGISLPASAVNFVWRVDTDPDYNLGFRVAEIKLSQSGLDALFELTARFNSLVPAPVGAPFISSLSLTGPGPASAFVYDSGPNLRATTPVAYSPVGFADAGLTFNWKIQWAVDAGNRFDNGETAVFRITNRLASSFVMPLMVRVQGIDSTTYGSDSMKVTPIPEPESYALMLAGLGIVGLMARRRLAA